MPRTFTIIYTLFSILLQKDKTRIARFIFLH
jgi:hypothetical protein